MWIFLQSFCRLTSLCFVLDPNSTTCPEMIGVLLSITSFFEEVVVVYSMISISVSSSWNTEIIGKKILGLFLLTPTKEEETQNPEFSGLTWGNLKVELTKAFDWPQSKFFCILPMHSACAASLAASEAATAYSSKIFGQFCPSQKNARIACCLPKTFHTWSKFNI